MIINHHAEHGGGTGDIPDEDTDFILKYLNQQLENLYDESRNIESLEEKE